MRVPGWIVPDAHGRPDVTAIHRINVPVLQPGPVAVTVTTCPYAAPIIGVYHPHDGSGVGAVLVVATAPPTVTVDAAPAQPATRETDMSTAAARRRTGTSAGEDTPAGPQNVGATPEPVTYRDVFAAREFRALWTAQLLSIGGDQFARVALAVLIYQRTGSALAAALSFAAYTIAMAAGGLGLSWIADRYPRRAVMIGCDLACLVLVLAMTIPGVPLPVLVGLLFAVTLAVAPFLAARMATNRQVLGPDRFTLGNAITQGTYQVAGLAGFAAGGLVVGLAGWRPALLIDAGTFATSAIIVRLWVRARPAPDDPARPRRPQLLAGARLVFARPFTRYAMLLMWVCAFYAAPEGVITPLAAQLGGGPETVGWLLTAMAGGAAAGLLGWNRFVPAGWRLRSLGLMACAACAVLILFTLPLGLAGALAVLACSGLFTGYLATAGAVLIGAVPDERRGQAGGVIGAGMSLGQGLAIIAAGAAAGVISPAAVVAVFGAAGTVAAVVLSWRWRHARG
jgi:predicted MFS family arabinose efflux permease